MTTRQCRSHNPLYQVLDLGVTPEVVSVISHRASTVLPYQTAAPVSPRSNAVGGNFDSPSPELVADRPAPPGSRSSGTAVKVPPMQDFISRLAVASRVNIGTLVSTLVYLDRLKHNMPSHATGK
ncbi:PHO85 cyclin-1 [Tieghemiomyces parasiticus]|uniref:PHO85 cyclin-1 n=1 Tax=Tieghemiomyces parasiticus TaxID=78921 RepID=A0A9W8DY79_9FUNG|nr:PHO85 cyclin-1 [Tieghemiomyces parasiticus]